MAPRGLSAADKRIKMLEIFHETAEFFTLKELEKIAPKSKGIKAEEAVQQSVKEVLDDLVSDGLVNFDKIGTSNYFWSFPSAAGAMKTAAVSKAQQELDLLSSKVQNTTSLLEEAKKGREDTTERRNLLCQLSQIQNQGNELKSELAAFTAADPAMYERKKRAAEVAKDAAHRWTDNTSIIISHIVSLGMSGEDLRAQLGLAEDWDDLK